VAFFGTADVYGALHERGPVGRACPGGLTAFSRYESAQRPQVDLIECFTRAQANLEGYFDKDIKQQGILLNL
jgi:hypothetical protein